MSVVWRSFDNECWTRSVFIWIELGSLVRFKLCHLNTSNFYQRLVIASCPFPWLLTHWYALLCSIGFPGVHKVPQCKLPSVHKVPNVNSPVFTRSPNVNSPVFTRSPNVNSPVFTRSPNVNTPVFTRSPNVNWGSIFRLVLRFHKKANVRASKKVTCCISLYNLVLYYLSRWPSQISTLGIKVGWQRWEVSVLPLH